ncbi:MAG: PIN domain-containing protein [bacterium]|nr:PIN domain-containing protein [bacterium]
MILLDTNVLLRLYAGYEADLAPTATRRIDQANLRGQVAMSPLSFFEIGVLNQKKRLPREIDVAHLWFSASTHGIKEAPLAVRAGIRAASLHGEGFPTSDPVDRLLVATALSEGWELATIDRAILAWNGPLQTLDARP